MATPHSVSSELVSDGPYFTPQFQARLSEGTILAEKLAISLSEKHSSLAQDLDLNRLLRIAKELSDFRPTRTKIVAILGNSGEGNSVLILCDICHWKLISTSKSSLINALLHCPDIAKTVSESLLLALNMAR